jgi:hypothetical protein
MQDESTGLRLDETARLQIRHTSAIIYNQHYPTNLAIEAMRILGLSNKRTDTPTLIDNLQDAKTYSGTVTESSKKRIQKAVNLLLMLSPSKSIYNPILQKTVNHRLSFITLTISSSTKMLTAKEAYSKLLKPFLQWFTITKGIKTYIWKAELQKRGQIHYHITTPAFIVFSEIKEKWNYLQRKEGLLSEFKTKYGHDNPNSIDIHSVYKVKNIEAYLVKYLAKADSEKKETIGKIWDCSENLKGKKYFTIPLSPNHIETIVDLADREKLKLIECEHCAIIQMKDTQADLLLYGYEHISYQDWLKTLVSKRRIKGKKITVKKIKKPKKLIAKPYAKKMIQIEILN